MSIELRVVTTKRQLRRFVAFPFSLYRKCPQWVPPLLSDEFETLRTDRNPAFEFCRARYWLAYKNGKIVGRVAGIINDRYIEKWESKNARFGWIDFVDDPAVSTALLGAVEEWARSEGMTGVHGPMGFTDMDMEGMLIEGFDEMGTMLDIYKHPYYQMHMEANGYRKDTDWVEYEVLVPESVPEKVIRVGHLSLKRGGLTLVKAKKSKELLPYAGQIFDLLNEAYTKLYGTTDLSRKQVDYYIKKYFPFIDPRFNKVVIDEGGRLIAFGLVLPSLTTALQKARGRLFPFGAFHLYRALKKPRQIDLGVIAVHPDYQGRGIPAIMLAEVNKSCIEAGVVSAETSRELEDNIQVRSLWKSYNARQHKRRRAYLKELS